METESNAPESTAVENTVAFQSAEGASVTVDGADVTNGTAMAKDGKIVFTVTPAEGYEVTSILVDGTIPARTNDETPETNDYIIEGIQTDSTVVVISTQAIEIETESESETESEPATEAATEAESESESETEAVTESESETVVETESESETETVAETEVETESETEAVTETEAKKTRRKVRKAKTQASEDENGIAVSATPAPMTWNDSASYTDMGPYLSLNDDLSKNLEIYDENGNLVDHYNPDNQTVSGGRFKLNIPFSNEKELFPENGYLSIKLPDALHIGSSVGVTTLKWADEPDKPDGSNASYLASKYGDAGLFKVDEATNTLYVQMNPDYIKDYPRTVASSIDVWGSFRRSNTGTGGDKETIKIGNAELTVKFDGNPIEAEKSVGGYEEGKGFPFAVTVRSYATPEKDVLVTDTLGTNLTLYPESVKVTDMEGNKLDSSKYTVSTGTTVDGKNSL